MLIVLKANHHMIARNGIEPPQKSQFPALIVRKKSVRHLSCIRCMLSPAAELRHKICISNPHVTLSCASHLHELKGSRFYGMHSSILSLILDFIFFSRTCNDASSRSMFSYNRYLHHFCKVSGQWPGDKVNLI